jgi:threonyl-tRNA synthetase
VKLWEQSGHWENYQENMFKFEVENEKFALKPMNCPGHCLMFGHRIRSHRELPIRWADFGVLHRNELSGTLTGLTRVRRFQQDDAHIFCTQEQLANEISGAFDFLRHIYGIFGFTFTLALSTRPEKFLGDIDLWNKAEKQLEDALRCSGFEWKLNPGDGAFYGPKIDIRMTDALRRRHQCATIQLDFQLPIRFNLKYTTAHQTEERPVIIHRAILGSVERMIAILTENYSGKFPLWLSPKQICVIPVVSLPLLDVYIKEVYELFHTNGFNIDVDFGSDTLSKKVRNAQTQHYNYLFVMGEKEMEHRTVAIRVRDSNKVTTLLVDEAFHLLSKKRQSKSPISNLDE